MEIRTRKESNSHVHRELVIDNQVVSRLIIIDRQMRIGSSLVRMGGIGGMETKPAHRKKGYASIVMNDSVKYMNENKYDVSTLFGIVNFYDKFDYASSLAQYQLVISTRDAEEAVRKYRIRKFQKKDIDDLLKIYNENNKNQTCTILRTKQYWKGFKKGTQYSAGAKCIVVLSNSGRVIGYAVYDDFKEELRIAEIGYKKKDIFGTLLDEFARISIRMRVSSISVFLPPDHPFAEFCCNFNCKFTTTFVKNGDGMMRIININSLFEKIKDELGRRIQNSKFKDLKGTLKIKTDLGTVILNFNSGQVNIYREKKKAQIILKLPQHTLIQLIVGYRSLSDALTDSGVEIKGNPVEFLEALFPKGNPYMWFPDRF